MYEMNIYFKFQDKVITSQDSNGVFAAGIPSLVIGLLCIIIADSSVVFCRKL
jgi:hypothetical protein